MATRIFRSFSELAEVYKPSAILTRVAPGAKTFYAVSNRKAHSEVEVADIERHCRNYHLHIYKWVMRQGRPCAMVKANNGQA